LKSIRSFLADEFFRLKLIITILTLAVLLAISFPLWIRPLAIRIVLAIITGALFTLSFNYVNKLKEIADGSLKLAERSNALTERSNALTELTQNTLDSFFEMTNRPLNPERLKEFYLSIHDIYIHFIDKSLILRSYQVNNDSPIPSKITQESTQSSGTSGSVSVSGSFGKIIESSGQVKSDHSETERGILEKIYPEPSIESKVLAWQSSMIHLDKIGLGYEYCLEQLIPLEEVDQLSSEENEVIVDKTREKVRLMGVNGFILLNGIFSITDSDLQSYYELIFEHPLNDLDDMVNISFRVRLPKSEIPRHINDNSYLDKNSISAVVSGYVNPNQYDGAPTENPTFIDVNPIVVYSTPTIFPFEKFLATIIEKNSIKIKFLDSRKKELEAQKNELEAQKNELEIKTKEPVEVLIAQVKILEAKMRDLESQEKDQKTERVRIQD